MVAQFVWKKPDENPSGPGALFGWILKSASRISLIVGIAVRSTFTESGMRQMSASSITYEGDKSLEVNRVEK